MSTDNQVSIWDAIPDDESELGNDNEREFVHFVNGMRIVVTHETDEPRIGENKFGKRTFYFDVLQANQPRVLSVTSMKLMVKIKALGKLEGQTVAYTRDGAGYDTEYMVESV